MATTHAAGRATLRSKPGKDSVPCDNCGDTHPTMYEVGLAKRPGQRIHLQWNLCVTCRSHLEAVFIKRDKDYIDI